VRSGARLSDSCLGVQKSGTAAGYPGAGGGDVSYRSIAL
jgi:hypothetical protein